MHNRVTMRRSAWLAALLAVLLLAPAAQAKPKKGQAPDAAAAAAAEKDKPYGDWKKLTKDAEVKPGYFTLYQKRENLYLEIRPDQLDKPVLGIFSFARGIGSNFVLGGLPLNDRLLEFQRSGDRVLVVEMNTRFDAPAGQRDRKGAATCRSATRCSPRSRSRACTTRRKAVLVDLATFLRQRRHRPRRVAARARSTTSRCASTRSARR